MEQALRPHRGGTVLALGAVSVVLPVAILGLGSLDPDIHRTLFPMGAVIVPLGIAALVMGSRQLGGMKHLRIDPAGRTRARAGQALGAVGAIGWIALTSYALFMLANLELGPMRIEVPPGTQPAATLEFGRLTVELAPGAERFVTSHTDGEVEWEYREVITADGTWIKDGPLVRWNKGSTIKLEEGSYLAGKREGEWVFRKEDGSMDLARSGIYENDVRVQAEATPPGDYPHDRDLRGRELRRLDERPRR